MVVGVHVSGGGYAILWEFGTAMNGTSAAAGHGRGMFVMKTGQPAFQQCLILSQTVGWNVLPAAQRCLVWVSC